MVWHHLCDLLEAHPRVVRVLLELRCVGDAQGDDRHVDVFPREWGLGRRPMRIVAAFGGNALLRRGEPMEAETQRRNLATAAKVVAELVVEHEVVLTHGNGPQVGLLALQAEACRDVRPPTPGRRG